MPKELLNVKQVQEILGISERTAFRFIKNGELEGFKVGREWRFESSDIDAYIERQREKAARERSGEKPEQQDREENPETCGIAPLSAGKDA